MIRLSEAAAMEKADPSEPDKASPVVVVVEDETTLRMLAVEVLSEEGFAVLEAANADAALDVFAANAENINVLFTDVRMPGSMNGLELAYRIHHWWPRISVLIASGNTFLSSTQLPKGARYLPKPYDLRRVAHHLRELVAAQ